MQRCDQSSGPIARWFIERGCHVTGVDQAPTMVELCRKRFPEMSWLHGDMRQLDLGAEFDIVVAWDSFFHLSPDEQRSTLQVFRKHTRARGALVFTSGPEEGEAIGGNLFGDTLYHASLDREEYRTTLTTMDYTILRYTERDPACGEHTVWVAGLQ